MRPKQEQHIKKLAVCFSVLYLQYLFFRKEDIGHKNENFGLEVFFDPLIIEHEKYSMTAPELIMFNERCCLT